MSPEVTALQTKINELNEALKTERERVAELQKENASLIKENKKLAKKVATVQDEYVSLLSFSSSFPFLFYLFNTFFFNIQYFHNTTYSISLMNK